MHVRFPSLVRCLLPLAGFLVPLTAIGSDPTAFLTIGHGEAWVREFFPPSGQRELDHIVWENPPAEVELDTLQVWNVKRPWPIADWRWASALSESPTNSAAPTPILWRPSALPKTKGHDRLDIRLAAPMSHVMGHSLTYRLPGLTWNALYQVIIRGVGPTAVNAVQVDVLGLLRIINSTATAWPSARVSIHGADPALAPVRKLPGMPSLDRLSPLTELWFPDDRTEPPIPALYPLRLSASIPAAGQTDIPFARVLRKPAQIVHQCRSADIPSPTRAGGLPLRRTLWIPNTTVEGLGFPLPPGRAELYLGALRGPPAQTALAAHTPFPGVLRFDMGLVPAVRAIRASDTPLAPLDDGTLRTSHSITLINDLESPVRILIEEKPDTARPWKLIRSSSPADVHDAALHFDVTVPPLTRSTLIYSLWEKDSPGEESALLSKAPHIGPSAPADAP